MEHVELIISAIISILTGLITCIPLVVKLVQVIKDSVKSKNWTALMQLILKLMSEAETVYSTGAEKKDYVMNSVVALKDTLNYDVDMDAVSAMIDSLVEVTKVINVKVEEARIEE